MVFNELVCYLIVEYIIIFSLIKDLCAGFYKKVARDRWQVVAWEDFFHLLGETGEMDNSLSSLISYF